MTDADKIAALEARLNEAEDTLRNFGNQLIALRTTATTLVMALNAVAPGTGDTIRDSIAKLADGVADDELGRVLNAILFPLTDDDITHDPDTDWR